MTCSAWADDLLAKQELKKTAPLKRKSDRPLFKIAEEPVMSKERPSFVTVLVIAVIVGAWVVFVSA